MLLTLDLSPELEDSLSQQAKSQGLSVDRYALALLEQIVLPQNQSHALNTLLQSWIDEDTSQEDQATGEFLIEALDEDRSSNRKLFPADKKGITW